VIAKWAQTLDGRMITKRDEPRWISNETSRRMVHRERGRVDAILTGIGTVLADDPLLLPRGVPVRRMPQRIVLDTHLRVPVDSRLAATSHNGSVTVVHDGARDRKRCNARVAWAKRRVRIEEAPRRDDGLDIEHVLRMFAAGNFATVLTEAGPTLLASLFRKRLVNQAWAFVGGGAMVVEDAIASVPTFVHQQLSPSALLSFQSMRTRRDDLILLYRVG
jgi:diaminohydroxyphosphoribosylaminopyrimidine deaminase/5-amino-6-(5-phosphoribosylamino)uracil reductase